MRAPRGAKTAAAAPYRKVERHVHFEAPVRPGLLIEIARRNVVELPAATVEGLRRYYRVESFGQSIARRIATCRALCVADGFREGAMSPDPPWTHPGTGPQGGQPLTPALTRAFLRLLS